MNIELERDEARSLVVILQAWRDASSRNPALWDDVGDDYVDRRTTCEKCGSAFAKLMRSLRSAATGGSESKPPGKVV